MTETEAFLFDTLWAMRAKLERDIDLLDSLVWICLFQEAGMPV